MPIAFTKMQGLGNDYITIDGFRQSLAGVDLPTLARAISDRHRGVGGDGLILIAPPPAGVAADARMEMYNADGSRGEMCGNGLRCVAKYLVDRGHVRSCGGEARLRVQTDRGVVDACVSGSNDRSSAVRVSMGRPILDPREVPVAVDGPHCVCAPIEVEGRRLTMTCVSMGNPHAVFLVDDLGVFDLPRLGPLIERHRLFPRRVNVHAVRVASRREVHMQTWERGAGLTQACGSGACAVVVAGVLEGRLDRSVRVHLPGGELEIEWPADEAGVVMSGPAEEVFTGEWPG